MSSHSSMDRAPPGVREVMGWIRDGDFVPRSCHADQFTFHNSKICSKNPTIKPSVYNYQIFFLQFPPSPSLFSEVAKATVSPMTAKGEETCQSIGVKELINAPAVAALISGYSSQTPSSGEKKRKQKCCGFGF